MNDDCTAIWDLLHDGIVDHAHRHDRTLHLDICVPYLADRALPGSSILKLILHDCSGFTLKPWDSNSPITDPRSISNLGLQILSTASRSAPFQISTDHGILQIEFTGFSIQLEDGSPISFQKLDEIAAGYWDDFQNRP